MSSNPKTITVFLDASSSGERRAAQAAALAQRWDAHLVGVYVVFKGVTWHPSITYARHEKAIAGVVAYERRIEGVCDGATEEICEHFQALCGRLNISSEFRRLERSRTDETAITNSLHSDLLVVGHPEPSGLPDDMSAQRILLASGVPLLIIPNAWRGETIGERIMIGWNASPEARRAVSDAMCFLVTAKSVTALVVNPADCKMLGGETGCDIAQQLGRHGAHAEVEYAAARGRPKAEVILDRARQSGADLLVVGARNPADLRRMVMGNSTRILLTKMPVPVLISR